MKQVWSGRSQRSRCDDSSGLGSQPGDGIGIGKKALLGGGFLALLSGLLVFLVALLFFLKTKRCFKEQQMAI